MESASEADINSIHTRTTYALLCVLGAALLLAADWCVNLVHVADYVPAGAMGSTVLRIAMAASYIACAVRPIQAEQLAEDRVFRMCLLATLLLGHMLYTYAALVPTSEVMKVLGAVLFGLSFAYLLLFWISQCCTFSPRSIAIVFPSIYFVVGLLYFVLAALPTPLATATIALLPCISGACFVVAKHLNASERPTAAFAQASPAQDWQFPFYPVALMVVFKFVFNFSLAFTRGASMYGPLGMLAICGLALLGAIFFYDRFQLSFLYKIALPCMVAGLLIISWVHLGNNAATMVSNAGNIAFELFILITLAEACRRYTVSPFWLFGIVEATAVLFSMLGLRAGRFFIGVFPIGSLEANILMMVMVVVLVGLSAFLFNERMMSRTFATSQPDLEGASGTPNAPADDVPNMALRCAMVARQFNLSRREEEILELLAQGMGVARIEEELFISRSTVKTHIQHIYEKLDVHSREEALAMIDNGGPLGN